MHPLPAAARSRSGSVIVLVLVLMVLLTFIVVAFLEEATAKIKYYGLFHNRDDLRTDAYSALEISLAVVNQYREIEGALWGPAQGWGNPLESFGFTPAHASSVHVTFEDESARLPLATLEYDSLLMLFRILGFSLQEAESLADGLLDWTDEDDMRRLNGFDGDDYRDMDPPYRPANAPIRTWDEFRLIRPFNTLFWDEEGRPAEAWQAFRGAVSLYHTGAVNINHASPTVLALLEEKGLLSAASLAFFREGPDGLPGTGDDRLLRNQTEGIIMGEGGLVSTRIELLRVRVEAVRGDARFEVEALVTWSGANPGASATRTEPASGTRQEVTAAPGTAAERQQRARGSARTAPSAAAGMGYPFRFVRITENRKF